LERKTAAESRSRASPVPTAQRAVTEPLLPRRTVSPAVSPSPGDRGFLSNLYEVFRSCFGVILAFILTPAPTSFLERSKALYPERAPEIDSLFRASNSIGQILSKDGVWLIFLVDQNQRDEVVHCLFSNPEFSFPSFLKDSCLGIQSNTTEYHALFRAFKCRSPVSVVALKTSRQSSPVLLKRLDDQEFFSESGDHLKNLFELVAAEKRNLDQAQERLVHDRIIREEQETAFKAAEKEHQEKEKKQVELVNMKESQTATKSWAKEAWERAQASFNQNLEETTKIIVRLPGKSARLEHSFPVQTPVNMVYTWLLATEDSLLPDKFTVSTTFPSRKLLRDQQESFSDAGLTPNAVLAVHLVEDDD
jgi:UBX domain